MTYHFTKVILILGIIIPTFLFSACSEKHDYVHIASKSKGWLGIQVKNITERRLDNLKLDYGLEVIKVYANSPAEKAGLEVDDILLKINGSPLEQVDKLSEAIDEVEIDEKVKIIYLRKGKELETEATIAKQERRFFVWNDKHKNLKRFISDENHAWLGVSTEKLTDQLRQFFNVPEYLGVLVNEVIEDSPAQKYGLKAGDVIIQVGRKEIEDHKDLMRAVDRYDPGEEVEVKIVRDKKEQVVKVTLEEGKGTYHHFSFKPENFEVYIPDMEIEIPEIDLEELEKLEDLDEKLRDELESHSDELKEEMEELKKEMKKIKFHTRNRKSSDI
jgi:C-terminal processing protease CtpA/Prc